MQSYLSSANKQSGKMQYRNIRAQYAHSHQERNRSHLGMDSSDIPVEFKGEIFPSDTPKLIFGSDLSISRGPVTPQHEENIKFISDEWQKVRESLKNNEANQTRHGCVEYIEKEEFVNKEFKPFDLEEFWGKKFLSGVIGNEEAP